MGGIISAGASTGGAEDIPGSPTCPLSLGQELSAMHAAPSRSNILIRIITPSQSRGLKTGIVAFNPDGFKFAMSQSGLKFTSVRLFLPEAILRWLQSRFHRWHRC
jgi:hypothetical protein